MSPADPAVVACPFPSLRLSSYVLIGCGLLALYASSYGVLRWRQVFVYAPDPSGWIQSSDRPRAYAVVPNDLRRAKGFGYFKDHAKIPLFYLYYPLAYSESQGRTAVR